MKALPAFLILALIPLAAVAGPNRWTSTGPGADAVSRVYISPNDVNTAFAQTKIGIYKTSDAGLSWHPVSGVPQSTFTALTVAADGSVYAAVDNRIFISDDGGEQWSERASPDGVFVFGLAFDPVSQRLIICTSGPTPLYSSDDRGVTWSRARVDTSGAPLAGVVAIYVSANAQYALAGNPGWVLRSTDGGRSWQRVNLNVGIPIIGVYADPSSDWVYAISLDGSVFVSKNSAKSWTRLPIPGVTNFVVPVGRTLFAATTSGVFVYDDGTSSARPLGPLATHFVSVSSSIPHHFYAAADYGVITFADGDAGWTHREAGLPGLYTTDVDLARIQPSTAYAATSAGVFRTDDGGQSWSSLLQPAVNASGNVIAVSPATPNTAYLSSGNGQSGGIFKTDDAGATWKQVSPKIATKLAIAPSDPKTIYASLLDGMYKSSDGGNSWRGITSELSIDYLFYYYGAFYTASMAIDASSSSRVIVGQHSGVWQTTDGGNHWMHVDQLPRLRALTIDPADPSTLYAGASMTALIRSSDDGLTWNTVGLVDKRVTTIAAGGSALFAGTQDGHIYRSDDRGDSWIGFDDGMSFGSVLKIVADPTGEHLYAATSSGVFSYDVVNQAVTPQRLIDDPQRLPRILNAAPASAIIVPVTGTIRGAAGTLFTTELILTNSRALPQSVVITRLPREGESGIASFTLTVPPTGVKFIDLAERLGADGLGSLVITPVDPAGNLDPNASISASTLIWSYLANGLAPISQSIPSAGASSLSAHLQARITGLRQDPQVRMNNGIVNLSADAHHFTIQLTGEHGSSEITIQVPAFSLVQFSQPEGNFGTAIIDAFADTSDTRWLLYGTSIDRTTGQAQTLLGVIQ